jgi:DNA-binding IclR family transcriptional regulator
LPQQQSVARISLLVARTGRPAIRRVAAVERAAAVLDALADGSREAGTNEIARRTGINPSTVSRLLATLAAVGLVEYAPDSGRYRLGVRLLQLGQIVLSRLDLREVTRPHLRQLMDETGETATLSVPGERDAVTVDFVQSESSVQSVARVGRPSIAHATAAGKTALAFRRGDLPPGRLKRYTARTIIDRPKLAAELERIRERGFATALGEREDDLNAIAAPIFGGHGELLAVVGLQGPASRFTETAMEAAVESLLAHASAISRALGAERVTGKEVL